TFAFGLYKGHYTYPMVAQFSTGILAQFSISIYTNFFILFHYLGLCNITKITLKTPFYKHLPHTTAKK
ncbi:hypothetical protein ABG828_08295, partial [Phocaeicola vulgatus]|nr:hypothetical protein [Phocaeicola vulgatus]MDB0822172.1 hypothetical protein [Phocaeicola vulgatus]